MRNCLAYSRSVCFNNSTLWYNLNKITVFFFGFLISAIFLLYPAMSFDSIFVVYYKMLGLVVLLV
jgi:hypothetical protein